MTTRCQPSLVSELRSRTENGVAGTIAAIASFSSFYVLSTGSMAFYRLILILAHFFLAVKHCLLNGVELLWKLALPLFVRNSKSNGTKHARILQDSKHLSKLPDHISFVIVEKDIRFMDLAQMIVWSMAMGISYISIYDREGNIASLCYNFMHTRQVV